LLWLGTKSVRVCVDGLFVACGLHIRLRHLRCGLDLGRKAWCRRRGGRLQHVARLRAHARLWRADRWRRRWRRRT
jgi:hypothetical protein